MSSHPFNLLRALPWSSDSILGVQNAGQLIEAGGLKPYGEGFKATVKNLETFEKENRKSGPFYLVLSAQPDEMVRERLRGLSVLSAERLSNLASILLDYRLIDVALSLQTGPSVPTPHGQTHRLPIPVPPKMFFRQADNWPSLVVRGLQLLRDCEDDHGPPNPSPSSDPTLSIFTSLVRRQGTVEGHKILGNFECAAAHLSLYAKGIIDLPSDKSDFAALVLKLCNKASPSPDGWSTFFHSIKSVHAFKLPLQISLSISPICLLLPSSLMNKDMSRQLLLQIWQGLGGERPMKLVQVEVVLWKALFDSACGLYPLPSRLRSAFREVGMIDLSDVGFPACEWLRADPTLNATCSSKPVQRGESLANPIQVVATVSSDRPSTAGSPTPESTQSSRRPTTRSLTDSSRATCRDRTPARHLVCHKPPPPPSGRRARRARFDTPSSVSSDTDYVMGEENEGEALDGSEPHETTPNQNRARTMSKISEPHLKAVKLEDGSRKRIYESIDLTAEMIGPPMIDLTVGDDTVPQYFKTPGCMLWDDKSSIFYVAKFHHRQETAWFGIVLKSLPGFQGGGQPPFLSDPSTSFFALVQKAWIDNVSVPAMQRLLRNQVIVVCGISTSSFPFGARSLGAYSLLDKHIRVLDFSIPPERNRVTIGTLSQIIHAAQTEGKALAAIDLPLPGGVSPLPSLASDAYAWNMTIDLPWCGRRWEMPRSALRRAEVATRNTYQSLAFSKNGFATHIEVRGGSQLLVVAQPSPFNPHPMTSFHMLEHFRQPYASDTKTMAFQAFHLRAGAMAVIGPLTPFTLLSTDNSVTQICDFYSVSTLQASCVGFVHSALTLDAASNPSQGAAVSLLRRLVHYFHAVYFNEHYIVERHHFEHVPDALTQDGVIALLTVSNTFEIMNALIYDISDFDRHLNIEARRLCRTIVAWLRARFTFVDSLGRTLDLYNDIALHYLAQEVASIVKYLDILQKHRTPRTAHIKQQIESSFRTHSDLQAELARLRGSDMQQLGWRGDMEFVVSLRPVPGYIPDDIRGETDEDLTWFSL